jgi:hypothetical protein
MRSRGMTNRIKKWLLMAGGIWLASCNLHRDVTQNPARWSRLDETYVLTEPVFLVQWPDTKEYSLEVPGKGSMVPRSLEDYYAHPDSWMYHR